MLKHLSHYTVEYGNNVTLDLTAVTLSSLLQITDVKLRDAGDYRCLIEYGELTTKQSPETPYRIITPGAVSTGHNEWKLTCQSEGYPEAEVIWQNRDYEDLSDKANTRYESGSDQLYLVTSTLTIKSGIDEIFYCTFWNKELQENTSAILHIAGNISQFCLFKLSFSRASLVLTENLSLKETTYHLHQDLPGERDLFFQFVFPVVLMESCARCNTLTSKIVMNPGAIT
uniref:Ig-like domain-containing protein n=1 Tax=Malurus cyaneus samueli TaxID=2593467 RepID=A0A8C5TML4_9PASS